MHRLLSESSEETSVVAGRCRGGTGTKRCTGLIGTWRQTASLRICLSALSEQCVGSSNNLGRSCARYRELLVAGSAPHPPLLSARGRRHWALRELPHGLGWRDIRQSRSVVAVSFRLLLIPHDLGEKYRAGTPAAANARVWAVGEGT